MKKLVDKLCCGWDLALVCILLLGGVSGCQDPREIAKQQDAAQGDQQQAGADHGKQAMPPESAEEHDARVQNAGAEQKNDNRKSAIHKTTAVVIDAKKAANNPDFSVVDGKIKGVDPFTQAGSAYFSMASRASTLGMQQAIQTHKALNDKFPSYDEYMKMMKENRVEFAQLPPYQMYGYDDETGHILVLQDDKKKAQLYKEAGIPLD
tara:strand:- start:1307 stop:1927 length:621 start_codon:yes stop_codon:yes gene_type:complete